MKTRLVVLSAVLAVGIASTGTAADIAAGKASAEAVCGACHGVNGVSISPGIPNLAAQRAGYIVTQLAAFASGKRKHPIMSPLAARFSDARIADVAAYYESLPGASDGMAKSKPLARYMTKRIALPASLDGFTHYFSFNNEGRKQLRKVYANAVALEAARAGKDLPDGSVIVVEAFKAKLGPDKMPVIGADGFYVSDGRAGFVAMERQAGWGDDFPSIIRNENWHYAVFKADRSPRPVNQAACLACHLPHAKDSYLFSMKELKAVAAK